MNRFLNVISIQNRCCYYSDIDWKFSKEYNSGARMSPYPVTNLRIESKICIIYIASLIILITLLSEKVYKSGVVLLKWTD